MKLCGKACRNAQQILFKRGGGSARLAVELCRTAQHAELQGRAYKVAWHHMDADYASQACPLCGYTSKQNRPNNGLLFICRNEQCPNRRRTGQPYTLHADLIGARNLAMRTLLTRQDWVRTGQLSVAPGSELGPDASDSGLKAAHLARLARYAELRWES